MYDSPVLEHVIAWKDEVLLRWIALLLHSDDASASNAANGKSCHSTLLQPTARTATTPLGGRQSLQSMESFVAAGQEGGEEDAGGGSGTGAGGGAAGANNAAYGWAQRLGLAVHEAFCSARISELFDIIADYPDSAVAIGELKVSRRRDVGGGRGRGGLDSGLFLVVMVVAFLFCFCFLLYDGCSLFGAWSWWYRWL